MKKIKHIKFLNKKRPELDFDLVKLESLLSKNLEEIFQPHKTDFFLILIITQGQGSHSIDFTEYTYKKGTVLTIRKDQMHRFNKNSSAKGYLLLFTEDFLTSHFGKDEVLRAFQLFNELLISPKVDLRSKEFEVISKLLESIKAEYNEKGDEFSRVIIRSSLHVLLVKLFRIKTKNTDKLLNRTYFNEFLQFQELIESNFTTTRKALDYAKMMNCTSRTLNNICRSILDKSAKTVINDIVITRIKRLLINTTLSVTEIAYESGFDDPTNMYRYFKTQTKSSPESFRKDNR